MQKPACPLCGQALRDGDGLEALGRHFERCPKTDRIGPHLEGASKTAPVGAPGQGQRRQPDAAE